MRLVLDSNEYLFAMGPTPLAPCQQLVDILASTDEHDVRIHRTIVREVSRKLPEPLRTMFYRTLKDLLEEGYGIDEDFVVPHHVAQHYQDVGFKEADAHVAAYATVVGAEILISENRRHFHAMADQLPFHVMDAMQFLKHHTPFR